MTQFETTWQSRMQAATDRWREHGFDIEWADLWYPGERNDVADYLNARGWKAVGTSAAELFLANRVSVEPHDEDEAAMFNSVAYVSAIRW